jgi:hypothetical protein
MDCTVTASTMSDQLSTLYHCCVRIQTLLWLYLVGYVGYKTNSFDSTASTSENIRALIRAEAESAISALRAVPAAWASHQ